MDPHQQIEALESKFVDERRRMVGIMLRAQVPSVEHLRQLADLQRGIEALQAAAIDEERRKPSVYETEARG